MFHLTPRAAVYLHALRAERDGGSPAHVIRIAPAEPDEVRGVKLSFVELAPDGDQVSASQGFYLSVDRSLAYELDDKLLDLMPDGQSVYIGSG